MEFWSILISNNQSQITSSEDRQYAPRKLKAEKFSRYFLLVVLLEITVVFFHMIKIFLVPVILAAVFVGMFYRFYRWMLTITKKGLSVFVCCLILLLALLVPTCIVANLVSREAIAFYHSVE